MKPVNNQHLPDTLIRYKLTGTSKFASDVNTYCDSYQPAFAIELGRQAGDLLTKRHWLLFLCTGFVIAVNSLKAGSVALIFLIPLSLMIFFPLVARRWFPRFQRYDIYLDVIVGMHAGLSAMIAVLVLGKGFGLSNGPIQALLIVSCWFVFNTSLPYLLLRNFLYAVVMVGIIKLQVPAHFQDAVLQGLGGFVGGSFLAYVNLRNQRYKFYAISLKERWNDHLVDLLNKSEESNRKNIEEIAQQRGVIAGQFEKLSKIQLIEILANSVQMLAHDVRKPFSVMRMGITMLKREKDPAKFAALTDRLDRSLAVSARHVDDMVQDLLAAGNGKTLKLQSQSPILMFVEAILQSTSSSMRNIKLAYDCQHQYLVEVDTRKMQRVFNNLVGNAFDAAEITCIRLITREEMGRTRIGLFNDQSYIPPEKRHDIFNSFMTDNKKSGTGLGLAIASQMVRAHDGVIYCESEKETGTTFWFTLPTGREKDVCLQKILPLNEAEVNFWFMDQAN